MEEIDPCGDVIFIVGPELARLRVHSMYLKKASEVFAAMFGPRFSEGRELSEDHPKEVKLPEDNPVAMRIICGVIHFRTDMVPDKLSPVDILRVALAADKYGIVPVMNFALRNW
ncbi:uncharacterized protein K452DRAFT_224644, partial [Aplosporella prunicola CBS 121167]